MFDSLLQGAVLWNALAALFAVVLLLPARIIQRRHGYSSWIFLALIGGGALAGALQFVNPLGLASIVFFIPLFFLWAFALSTPKSSIEALI